MRMAIISLVRRVAAGILWQGILLQELLVNNPTRAADDVDFL
jgi:hypothetical protein